MRIAHDTATASSLWRQRERLGDLEAYEAPRKTDRAQWDEDTSGAIDGTNALIDALGENNPILRDLLETAKQEIYIAGTENAVRDPAAAAAYAAATSGGRRLMQRREYNVRMTDELITAEIMEFYGKGSDIEPTFLKLVLTHCPIAFQARVVFLVCHKAHARRCARVQHS